MLGLAGAAIAAGKSAAIGSALSSVSEGVSGLFGPTATDRRRDSHADALLSAALNGDASAVRQLEFEWLYKREGKPGDMRTPIDGKYSPGDVRDLAKSALVQFYKQTGNIPPAEYASKLGIPIPTRQPPLGQQLVQRVTDPIVRAVGDAAVDSAAERARENSGKLALYVIGIVAVFVVATAVTNATMHSTAAK